MRPARICNQHWFIVSRTRAPFTCPTVIKISSLHLGINKIYDCQRPGERDFTGIKGKFDIDFKVVMVTPRRLTLQQNTSFVRTEVKQVVV